MSFGGGSPAPDFSDLRFFKAFWYRSTIFSGSITSSVEGFFAGSGSAADVEGAAAGAASANGNAAGLEDAGPSGQAMRGLS